jgi:hypothetical protein
MGIITESWAEWKKVWAPPCLTNQVSQYPLLSNVNPPAANATYKDWAMFQLMMWNSGWRSYSASLQTWGARITLGDNESPTVASAADVPNDTGGAWVGPGRTVTLNPRADDVGTGLKGFNLYLPTGSTPYTVATSFMKPDGTPTETVTNAPGAIDTTTTTRCKPNGDAPGWCPNWTVTGKLQINTDALPQGDH